MTAPGNAGKPCLPGGVQKNKKNALTGLRLRAKRAENGMPVTDLAKKAGFAKRRITAYESGKTEIPPEHLSVLADAFDVGVEYFDEHLLDRFAVRTERARIISMRLRARRAETGMSMAGLCGALGLSPALAEKCETGGRRFTMSEVSALAEALGTDAGYFYDARAPAHPPHKLPSPAARDKIVGMRLRFHRTLWGFSRDDLRRLAAGERGGPPTLRQLEKYEAGKRRMEPPVVMMLAKLLDVDVANRLYENIPLTPGLAAALDAGGRLKARTRPTMDNAGCEHAGVGAGQ